MAIEDEQRAGVVTRTIGLRGDDGGELACYVAEPEAPGRYPAVVLGIEAMGPNRFNRMTARDIAALGYVVVSPDYYRGGGPSRPDDYDDFTEVIAAIDELDFRRATFDLLVAIDWARAQPHVDASRVALWGYCTGGTLALLAAALDRKVMGTLLFFPSQPRFEALTVKRPAHAVDMAWAIQSPVLLIAGGDDPVLSPEVVAEMRRVFERFEVEHEFHVFEGAGHAFTGPARHMHHAEATAASWKRATDFIARCAARAP
jgi:carboxymethylenebutenolidase